VVCILITNTISIQCCCCKCCFVLMFQLGRPRYNKGKQRIQIGFKGKLIIHWNFRFCSVLNYTWFCLFYNTIHALSRKPQMETKNFWVRLCLICISIYPKPSQYSSNAFGERFSFVYYFFQSSLSASVMVPIQLYKVS